MTTLGDVLQDNKSNIAEVSVQYSPCPEEGTSMYIKFNRPKIDVTPGLSHVHIDGHSFPANIELRDSLKTGSVIFYSFDYQRVMIQVDVPSEEAATGALEIDKRPNGNILLRRTEGYSWFVLTQEEWEKIRER